jgi:ferredoxin
MASTLAASTKANTLINTGKIALEPIVAKVNSDLCEWCGICNDMCTYNAFEKVEHGGKMIAKVNDALCKGCGACTPVCPENAINVVSLADKDIESMIDAFIQDVQFSDSGEEKTEEVVVEAGLNGDGRVLPELSQKILHSLEQEAKAIPDIARELSVASDEVLYHLMSLRKYGMIKDTDEINEDEYYLYELKK